MQALSAKATQLVLEGSIREGFDRNSYFVKSTSSSNPHTVKKSSLGKYACGKDCIGYRTRKICSHVVAVAYNNNQLQECLQYFKDETGKQRTNLTAITTFGVNTNAGKNRAGISRARHKSPDTMTSMTARNLAGAGTIGELVARDNTKSDAMEYEAESSANPFRITIRRTRPSKPAVTPTTSTPFQPINISGRIRKCAGCWKDLKDGPDDHSGDDSDQRLCLRHKEHDFVWIESLQHWKKTFDNKHYHVFLNCVELRNPDFNASAVAISVNHTLSTNEVRFLKDRLHTYEWFCTL